MIEIIEVLKYVLPMLVLGVLFYFLLEKFFNENRLLKELNLKQADRETFLPQKYQAYERLAIFIERIKPTHLVRRVPLNEDALAYERALIQAIQEEYDHNVSQQIYVEPDTWKVIFSAKNATQNYIKQARENLTDNHDAAALQQAIIQNSMDAALPLNGALLQMQKDIQISV